MTAVGLSTELSALAERIAGWAREYGLDFWETRFEMVSWDKMNEIAAYDGFPVRYPHWRFGMEYDRLSKSYAYGLQKIYEMVINTVPAYAYLLEGNQLVDHKTVMAHVYAHVDFFKNNFFFSRTNRRMLDEVANHASRVRKLVDRVGLEPVESFLDTCLTLDNLIDIHAPFIRREPAAPEPTSGEGEGRTVTSELPIIRTDRNYMRGYLNPDDYVEAQRERIIEERKERADRFPVHPARDVLGFLLEHAPLKQWQRQLLEIVREEASYFVPQRQTKILNEGWAAYWHSKIMTEKALAGSELIDYADHHSGTLRTSPGQINPYKMGIELLRYVEDRWDKGKFGADWDDCDDMAEKARWDRGLGLGREKIFQVRQLYNDATFIDEFLTPDFAAQQKLYTFAYNQRADQWEIASREFLQIKRQLLSQLTNFGQPVVEVDNANYENRSELLLVHRHQGSDLDVGYARPVLEALFRIWRRPVNIVTRVENRDKGYRFDGSEHSEHGAKKK